MEHNKGHLFAPLTLPNFMRGLPLDDSDAGEIPESDARVEPDPETVNLQTARSRRFALSSRARSENGEYGYGSAFVASSSSSATQRDSHQGVVVSEGEDGAEGKEDREEEGEKHKKESRVGKGKETRTAKHTEAGGKQGMEGERQRKQVEATKLGGISVVSTLEKLQFTDAG